MSRSATKGGDASCSQITLGNIVITVNNCCHSWLVPQDDEKAAADLTYCVRALGESTNVT